MTTINEGSLSGKVCLITGSTSGIGRVTATALAEMGVKLVIHGRNRTKTENTVELIKSASGNPQIHYLLADFSKLDQVQEMATTFQDRFDRLDILINNAGAFFNRRILTPFGVEMTFLVNHLAGFTLTTTLLEIMKKSTPARIVNISSEGHRQGRLDLEDLTFRKGYFGMKAYGRSKLANILFAFELARRLEGSGVTANALHPGHIATNIWKNNFGIFGTPLKWLMEKIALSPEEGAQNSIYLSSAPDLSNMSGKYFIKNQPAQPSAEAQDLDLARRLWEKSEELTS